MSGIRVDIAWSPVRDDMFVTWGTDVSLYKVDELTDGDSPGEFCEGKFPQMAIASYGMLSLIVLMRKCSFIFPVLQFAHLLSPHLGMLVVV